MEKFIPGDIIKFNGKFLGDFSEYIDVNKIKKNEATYIESTIKYDTGLEVKINLEIKPYDSFELICDRLMKEFLLLNSGYDVIELNDRKYLIREYKNEIPFNKVYPKFDINDNTLSPDSIKYIKKLIVFQWLMGLEEISLDKIYVTAYKNLDSTVSSNAKDKIITYIHNVEKYNLDAVFVPKKFKSIIKTWFDNDFKNLIEIAKEMLDTLGVPHIRYSVEEFVRKIDPTHILWVSTFNLKLFIESLM